LLGNTVDYTEDRAGRGGPVIEVIVVIVPVLLLGLLIALVIVVAAVVVVISLRPVIVIVVSSAAVLNQQDIAMCGAGREGVRECRRRVGAYRGADAPTGKQSQYRNLEPPHPPLPPVSLGASVQSNDGYLL
jgi:hypothetical protein